MRGFYVHSQNKCGGCSNGYQKAPLPLSKAFEIEITPEDNVAAQIGDKLELTCSTIGCESPSFSWRSQLDKPLDGSVNSKGSRSILTMDPVGFGNDNEYLCSAFCDNVKKEKSIIVLMFTLKLLKLRLHLEDNVAAQIGDKLELTCSTIGCESPSFSWRSQLDKPLDGSVNSKGNRSILTMDPVGFGNDNEYLCSAFCDNVKKRKKHHCIDVLL
ncbi:hypothetical protein KIL84_016089 [Mauremys mutica]|uniref:Ig-like domain-containing protein n=1 Tax=Mauremys mutica TaxID=74926 RepID=A0A9D4AMG3_9SAUR|nr:hypothetical protein KIL84_016089 [Mauremys mutica]